MPEHMTHGQLCDIEAIKNLKARYFRFLDAKQWTDLRGLFTVDGSFEHPALGRFASIDEAVLAVSDRIGDLTTVHHGGLPEITLGGDDDARAIWPMASFTFRASPTAAGSRSVRPGLAQAAARSGTTSRPTVGRMVGG
jgi:hypothetical protein